MVISACTSDANYSGKGGMAAYSINPSAYLYHYKNGFTGVDSMGWEPDLQYTWSRVGAALTCGVSFNKPSVIEQLKGKYGHSEIVHDMNGVQFHHLQSKKIADFCSVERISEIKKVLHELSNEQPKSSDLDKNFSLKKKSESEQPHLGGLPVKAIFYDETETSVEYGKSKFSVYFFILSDNRFVALRSKHKADYFLSNLSTLVSDYPSVKTPDKYKIDGNKFSALRVFDRTKDKSFKPHILYDKYEGTWKGDVIHLLKTNWTEYPNGNIRKLLSYVWELKKVREYP